MKRIIHEVGRWPCYLHREARGLELATPGDSAMQRFEDELFQRLYSGEVESLPEKDQDAQWAKWGTTIHAACDQLPAFHRLADETVGDVEAAALGVEELVQHLRSAIDENRPQELSEEVLRRLVRTGAVEASEAVGQFRDAAHGMAWVQFRGSSSAQGCPFGRDKRTKGIAHLLRDDPRLKRIAVLAGRFSRIALSKRRAKVRHGAEEISDVELGNDVGRLLPVELVRLRHPRLRLVALRNLVERQAMQYALHGKEPLGRGPLVLLLDRSGSMTGDKDVWSSAMALAILGIAQAERRTFAVVSFTDNIIHEAIIKPGEPLPDMVLNLPCDGSTDIDVAVGRGLEIIEKHPGRLREADLVLITDGASYPEHAARLKDRASQLGVTVLGIGIGVERHRLDPWCDEIEAITRLDTVEESVADALFTRSA